MTKLRWRWLLLLVIPVAAFAGVNKHVKHKHWTDDFDRYFRKYSKHYFGPHIDWHWFKAQGIAESGLDPKATSSAGARGIMQILPGTYSDIKKAIPHIDQIDDPKWNIAAGIFYDRQLYRKWRKQSIPSNEKLQFAFASYNAGYGNVRKAFKRARSKLGEVKDWGQVAPYAPGQTRHYVRRINGLMVTDSK